jgi:hypothetical protein
MVHKHVHRAARRHLHSDLSQDTSDMVLNVVVLLAVLGAGYYIGMETTKSASASSSGRSPLPSSGSGSGSGSGSCSWQEQAIVAVISVGSTLGFLIVVIGIYKLYKLMQGAQARIQSGLETSRNFLHKCVGGKCQ